MNRGWIWICRKQIFALLFISLFVLHLSAQNIVVVNSIRTIAGIGGNGGFSGDGGPATAAQLNSPEVDVVDAAGNVYFADYENSRVRRIDAITGVITTIAGTGTRGFSGDGGQATSAELGGASGLALDSKGNLYIGDTTNNRVRMINL